ncbi:Long-chain-fatty-acid--CoA ligase [Symmachiella dynata]|uniref:AMP-binding protein n=1 Tax=Symmachiella dynata TaxID=2527995 RepID=UPI00118B6AED|nr:AMP-binding protein [Symmachiella dynata]QDT51093.1 Long-chain-fatty-acid--CoA ligase [Symmachiella dynata]
MTAAASPPWVDGLTIGEMLRETAQRSPDADALVFPQLDRRWSYAQLDADVDRVARGLLALGVDLGSHVAVWATNWPQWVLLQFATARIGAVLVTINPAYRAFELQYVLKQADIDTLFLLDKFRGSDYRAMLNEAAPELAGCDPQNVQLKDFPKLRHVIAIQGEPTVGMSSWESFLKGAEAVSDTELSQRESQLNHADAINIQYTSGTTGFPKGATLTHRNLLLNAYYIGQCQQLTAADRICIPVPFYHCFGCVLGVLGAAVRGAAMIIPAEHFDAEATLAAIATERATSIYGVPTMFIAQLDHPTRSALDLSSLRTGIMAGSPCPIEVMQRVVDELGAREITIAYGLTEASPVITQTRTDDPLELRVKTVGRPLPDVEVKIVDPATGEELGDEQQGELCARGHLVMLGYYQMPDATAAAIDDDGWLHSGDLAVRLPNGYYRITGRIKDMVCRGGENIYPREIEEFLYTHPAVGDVAVVGVPDAKYVEELAVWIRLKPDATLTEQDVQQFCRSSLAHYKVPRYVKFVTEFPQTVTGKIQKFKIRETMIAELGLDESETA